MDTCDQYNAQRNQSEASGSLNTENPIPVTTKSKRKA